jgi:dTDP-4-amino-4,6-dideoxygalactose transaminase
MQLRLKRDASELAIFGGNPQFEVPLHVGRPNIGDRTALHARMTEVFDRRWLTNAGPFVQELERRIAEQLRAKHCILMCNGTVALEIAIRAMGLHGEVIVPSFTFIATAHALQWQEITPVFCDVAPGTHSMDPVQVERLITPRTTGIIGVHVWGRPCAVEALEEIAARRGLGLLFDASHAFGCSSHGRPIGNFGRAEVFSFHATKFFNTGEGGAVVTNDDELAARVRLMKNFGFAGYDNVAYIGTNGKMSELSAAVGLTNLESLEAFVAIQRANYERYGLELAGLTGIVRVGYDETERCNYQYIVTEVDAQATGIARDRIVEILWAEGILARRYFAPGCHRMEPYRSLFPHAGLLLPNTEALVQRVLVLPTGSTVGQDEIAAIGAILRLVVTQGSEIARRIEAKTAPKP